MTRWMRAGLVIIFLLSVAPIIPAQAQSNADCLFYGTHAKSAKYCITMPLPPPYGMWNGDLVIFAHGYVGVNQPVDIPWSQMTFSDGMGGEITMPFLLNSMGYAFATTSYSENGLAIQQGINDILDLIDVFTSLVGTPARIYLVGASEGGLITTLTLERHPESFTGGLAACGPIGSFTGQVNYWGDFRVVFDYFMDAPKFDALPGTAVNIPSSLMKKWDSVYVPRITSLLMANPLSTQQLLAVTGAPVDPSDPTTIAATTLGILWYNVFATNDATQKLGGRPFDNLDRVYTNPLNPAMDDLLNAGVQRYKAQPSALKEIAAYYETSGLLTRPLVTMHTTGDPIVPFGQQGLYTTKVLVNNPLSPYVPMVVDRYGHCSFTLSEILDGFGTVVYISTGQMPPASPLELDADIQAESYKLSQ